MQQPLHTHEVTIDEASKATFHCHDSRRKYGEGKKSFYLIWKLIRTHASHVREGLIYGAALHA